LSLHRTSDYIAIEQPFTNLSW